MEKISKLKRIINKIYYQFFVESFDKKITFNFPVDFFRWDLINYIIKQKNYSEYLEIGCDQDQLFSKITIQNKIGVDPISGGNLRMTSNNFFINNKKNFDIVFIDGLHHYEQVKKDITNSLNFLNQDGIILVHDCLPTSISKQAVPRYRMSWNGDVWKAIVDLRQDENLQIYTLEIDQGIGLIKKIKNQNKLSLNKPVNSLKFKDFYYNYNEYMNLINLDMFKKIKF